MTLHSSWVQENAEMLYPFLEIKRNLLTHPSAESLTEIGCMVNLIDRMSRHGPMSVV